MKNVFSIFVNDMRGVKKNLILFAVIIGVGILPALYAWFNIVANWDPYSNTGELPFAVANLDKGFEFKGVKINAGDSIMDNLRKNNQMGWSFVDSDEAVSGTESGTYYAAVVIPEDFSEDLLSLISGKFEQATLQYYVNEKLNAVAPKITDKGVEAIEQAVDEAFVSKLTETLATAMDVTGTELGEDKDAALKKIEQTLENVKSDIDVLDKTTDLMISTLDSVDGLLKSTRELVPTIKKTLSKAGVMVDDVKSAVRSAQYTAKQIVPTIENILHSLKSGEDDVTSRIDDAFEDIGADPASAAAKLRAAETIIRKKITVNNELIAIFESVNTNLGVNCSPVIKALENSNTKANNLINKIDAICKKLDSGKTVGDEVKSELNGLAKEINAGVSTAEEQFATMKKEIESNLEGSFSSMDGVADFAQTIGSGSDQLNSVFKSASTMNSNLKKVFTDLKEFMDKMEKKIDETIDKLKNPGEMDSIVDFIRPIIQNPSSLGEFIASPVTSNRNTFFHTYNYGSAMTPFYSSLAIWVGGIVMVAVLCIDLSKRDRKKFPNAGPVSQYFGRYLTFFVIGQLQALMIGLGDMFFLKTQVENPYLFILACMISSFVYTFLIYSLTVTFSVIGKALAVIILVLQVAGSGGTFPVEVLPGPFQDIVPFLPFRYGVNALREACFGATLDAYWKDIGYLLLFLIPALLIGLLLRKPCARLFAFFNKTIEESDLIV